MTSYMQKIVSSIKDRRYHRQSVKIWKERRDSPGWEQAMLDVVKKFSEEADQYQFLMSLLSAEVVDRYYAPKGEFMIEFIEDRGEYEWKKSLMGSMNSEKVILYRKQNTDEIDGLEEMVERFIPADNVLLAYAKEIYRKDQERNAS